ncbi:MAG: hypothetical protein QM656_03330 [Paracoccaceae bacterium]
MEFDTFFGDEYIVPMGRKPLNVKETKVRLTDEQRQRIEALAGNYGMAAWIRDAVARELDRQEKAAAKEGRAAQET